MKKKVLIVDDDPEILKLLSYVLKEHGYQVVTSPHGDIMSKVGSLKPDLILLDCWLPDGFGDDVCRKIKAHSDYGQIPVILISAVNNLNFLAKECNANAYIEKPIDVDQLSELIKRYAK